MSNEAIFILTTLIDLAFVLFAFRMGKPWIVGIIVMNLIMVTCFAGKLIPIFGFVTNAANVFYASIFLATDALTEHYGKKDGYRSVLIGFMCIMLFVVLGQFTLLFSTVELTEQVSSAMQTVFGAVPRIAFASMVAYLIAQNFDVWFYHLLHDRTHRKYLWFRNNLSTATSQFVDSVVFFTIAFYGVMPNSQLIEVIFTGYVVKLIVATLDTPFIYLTYKVKRAASQ
ncbi:queuosine precursor transporter [Candidatus Thiosymbion oneisti]|uniref:queuosine precursor transporter n=1 Tax=Candidatus Thiosymbion oneisti TaxID=589554 RepID=UPI00106104D4|nr:queuosine precursor transporter [Candidatus Thiosymbion oneisti]